MRYESCLIASGNRKEFHLPKEQHGAYRTVCHPDARIQ
ncbi:MAG: hypothetical protein K0Q56_1568 [Sporolactobacillus laevolacticus]|nr:hypothetical protein [Sporolactobacillus laevolacticus]